MQSAPAAGVALQSCPSRALLHLHALGQLHPSSALSCSWWCNNSIPGQERAYLTVVLIVVYGCAGIQGRLREPEGVS